eukprot:CAMPEP_0176093922 /NCGR_PEP_ID=MMETSP0120_2-20121206/47062_1 /TAXON_ID=160619 /ORGANISM="Kryptoperidinium foliaceum, Strain CCMP 1326" /LENGTH=266 /DNA_ID=CAMNT_0017427857 /DNA_START=39 /DNA_END=836 /DNA_ORIENTATION=-
MPAFWKPLLIAGAVAVCRVAEAEQDADDAIEQDVLSSEQMRAMHGKIDRNGDGKISLSEVMSFSEDMRLAIAEKDIGTILGEMDGNKDGRLSWEELLADLDAFKDDDDKEGAEARREAELQKFKAADKNGDGVLDKSELPGLFFPETNEQVLQITAAVALKQKDANGDGKLSSQEFWSHDGLGADDLGISAEEEADFKALDLDNDGFLNLDELRHWESGRFHTMEAMKKLFEVADANSDSHLTAEELDAAREGIAASDAQYHFLEW